MTVALGWAASLAIAGSPHAGYALRPNHGIGPISLGEPKRRVERVVGHQTSPCGYTCFRTYDSPRGNLGVRYDNGRVTGMGSSSGQITLGGIPVRQGPKRLHRQLRGWRHFRCEGLLIYEHGSVPSASIYFGANKYVDVEVSASAEGGCGGQ